MDARPELRVSDADRERIAERLREAAGEGRLTVDELDERLDAAFAARTRADLEQLTADLPESARHPTTTAAPALPVVPDTGGATRRLISIMSGHDRRGRWRAGPKIFSFNLMGGGDIDFNDAELTAQSTELRVISIMGGADVRVPDGLEVHVSEFALMGSNDIRLGSDRPVPGGPVLHIKIFTLMGGTDVKRGRRLTREQRRALKAERRANERRSGS